MKIYDISQEVFSCAVYPGDMPPQLIPEKRMSQGDMYNLTSLRMGAHNGTHLDAPFHFLAQGKTVEQLSLEKVTGFCYVAAHAGRMDAPTAAALCAAAQEAGEKAARRILIKGDSLVTLEAAQVFAKAGVDLIGVESQSVGPEDAPMAVHLALLAKEIVLLEGLRLEKVPAGRYFLCAAPLSLGGADGAPCRAILVEGLEEREGEQAC